MCIWDIHTILSINKNCVLLCYRSEKRVNNAVKSIVCGETRILLHVVKKMILMLQSDGNYFYKGVIWLGWCEE